MKLSNKFLCLTFFLLFPIVSVFASEKSVMANETEVRAVDYAAIPNFRMDNDFQTKDIVPYKMSNTQKANMFKWICIGTAIGAGVGLILTITGGVMMGVGWTPGVYGYGYGYSYGSLYLAGGSMLGGGQALFWLCGIGAIVTGVFWYIFHKKANEGETASLSYSNQRVSFDFGVGNKTGAGYVTIRF